jgi:hypothetical protein
MRLGVLVMMGAVVSPAAAVPAAAGVPPAGSPVFRVLFEGSAPAAKDPWRVAWEPSPPSAVAAGAVAAAQQPRPRVVATEYSDAYRLRARIHRVASFAMLPLVGTEVYLGQSVYSGPTGGKRSAHVAVGAAIGTLFAVNTVTGVWNLWEGRKDPTNRKRRLVHGLLMLAADGGFLATAALAPENEFDERGSSNFSDRRATHRAVALTSIGIGTAGYLIMLFGGR